MYQAHHKYLARIIWKLPLASSPYLQRRVDPRTLFGSWERLMVRHTLEEGKGQKEPGRRFIEVACSVADQRLQKERSAFLRRVTAAWGNSRNFEM
jgi:hypothetical protein